MLDPGGQPGITIGAVAANPSPNYLFFIRLIMFFLRYRSSYRLIWSSIVQLQLKLQFKLGLNFGPMLGLMLGLMLKLKL